LIKIIATENIMSEAQYEPSHIANYLLWRANKEGIKDMSPLKLIKLIYFCYAWFLVTYDKPLFEEKIVAWKHGPVIPSIYHEFKRFGSNPITSYSTCLEIDDRNAKTSYPVVDPKDNDTFLVLDAVWDNYKNRTGWELRNITHEKDSAWKSAYQGNNEPLDDEEIKKRASKAMDAYIAKLRSVKIV